MHGSKRASLLVEKLIHDYPDGCHLEKKSQKAIDTLLAQRQDVLRKMLGSAQMLQENLSNRYVMLC